MPDQSQFHLRKLCHLSAVCGIALVGCAVFGALWSLPPAGLTGVGLALGVCLGCGIASRRSAPPPSPLANLAFVAILATSPLSLEWLERGLDLLRATSQQPLVGAAGACLSAATLVAALGHRTSRAALPPPPHCWLALAAGLLLGVSRVLPSIAPLWPGLVGLALLIWPLYTGPGARLTAALPTPAPATATDFQHSGALRGLLMGAAVPMLWMLASPLFAATAGWIMQSLVGLLVGFAVAGLARGRIGRFCQIFGPALLPLAILATAKVLLNGPALILKLHGLVGASVGDGYLASALLTSGVFAVLGFLAGPTGPKTATVCGLGIIGCLALPAILGIDAALLVVVGLGAILGLPIILTESRLRSRFSHAALSLAALVSLTGAPQPAALRLVAPYESFGDSARLAALVRTLAERPAQVDSSSGGSVISSLGSQQPLLYYRGAGSELGPQQRAADHLFGHLPGLLGEAPRDILLLGAGSGAVIDALRRGSSGTVQVYEASSALRNLIQTRLSWNRQAAADPAVRFLRASPLPLHTPARFDAILVDMPPVWLAGGASRWGQRPIARVAAQLRTTGTAVFRLPLAALSADELSSFIVMVCEQFPSVSAWLNPSGSRHLLLVAQREDRSVRAAAVFAAWERRAVREDLAAATMSGPEDVLERLLANQYGLLKMAANRGQRSWLGSSIVAGSRLRHGRRGLPLAALAEATEHEVPLVELAGLPEAVIAPVRQRLTRAREVRRVYLDMLDSWASGKAAEALGLASQLAQSSPSPARDLKAVIQPWLRRGQALRSQGLWQQARSEFLMAASFSPKDLEANLGLADSCRILGEDDQSERHYKLILAEDSQHLRASLGLADLRQRQQRSAEAVEVLEAIENSHPGSFPLLTNLAFGQMQLARGSDDAISQRLSRARVLFQRAAALEPGRPEARAGLGEVYFRMGQFQRALTELDRALLLEDSCHYRSWRGHALFSLGRVEEAEQEVQTALLACADLIDALVLLGNIMADNSRYQRAREAWEQVVTLDPDNKAARFNLDQLEQSGVERLEQ